MEQQQDKNVGMASTSNAAAGLEAAWAGASHQPTERRAATDQQRRMAPPPPRRPIPAQQQAFLGYTQTPPPSDIYGALICPDCKTSPGDFEEDFTQGDLICRECGLVIGRVVDMGEEVRNFADSDTDRSRTASVDTLFHGGLRTDITGGAPGKGRAGMAQLHSTVQTSKQDAKLLNGYAQIELVAEILKASESTKLVAKQYFNTFECKRNQAMRLQLEPLAATILFFAAKKTMTLKQISRETEIPLKHLSEWRRKLLQTVPDIDCNDPVARPQELVPRMCSDLNLAHKLSVLAREVAVEAADLLEGKSPSSIAAASILMASQMLGEPTTAQAIAEVASISAATVVHVHKALQEKRKTTSTIKGE
eukprot:TRINITY_DN9247_c0_g1_i1.p1 TRINITY_DN9247_c0_g1~~TRINITY_DN9247_c0_g1_i1.p1  ORF type:complete len:364 (+),score=76.36 TRINITY_DN9247_c0_g1_i1:116-1207(+)